MIDKLDKEWDGCAVISAINELVDAMNRLEGDRKPVLDPNEAPEGYVAVEGESLKNCTRCAFADGKCWEFKCTSCGREDGCYVHFVKKEKPMQEPEYRLLAASGKWTDWEPFSMCGFAINTDYQFRGPCKTDRMDLEYKSAATPAWLSIEHCRFVKAWTYRFRAKEEPVQKPEFRCKGIKWFDWVPFYECQFDAGTDYQFRGPCKTDRTDLEFSCGNPSGWPRIDGCGFSEGNTYRFRPRQPACPINWDDPPAWANWVAMDESGLWMWFTDKPSQSRYGWASVGARRGVIFIPYSPETCDIPWEESLSERPTT